MRDIRFRAWDTENKEWVYSKPMPDMGFWEWVSYDNTTIFNEWTGITDKNGKYIYEGDIVKHSNGIKKVYYDEQTISFQMDLSNYVLDQEIGYDIRKIEVIGNIYQNPELLNKGGKE
jgi:hypothetical protein